MMVWLEIFSFLHFVGLAWGVGGATVATIISMKSEREQEVASASTKIMPAISKLIWLGLVLLIISGIALPRFMSWPLDEQNLLIKHVLVAWIVIFAVILTFKSKKIQRLAPKQGKKPSQEFLANKKQMKFFSIINLILWYAVALLAAFV